tara:strand:+ start:4522 stop:5550 length:1029 start_codon:yes stop_codon:yes gene_type:complete
MATFEAQVEGLTSLSIDGSSAPTQTELTQFLTDGAKDVINSLPGRLLDLCSSQQTFTSTTVGSESETLNTGKVLRVFRNSGDYDVPCRFIDASQKGYASDPDEVTRATSTDPVFYIENNKLNVLPESGSCKYDEVQYPAVAFGDSAISAFPDEAEHLVVLYASIKSLQNVLGNISSNSDITTAFGLLKAAVDQAETAGDKYENADSESVFGDESTFLTNDSQLTRVKSALDNAEGLIDGNEPSSTTDAYGALANEDVELVSAAINVASVEISRAQSHLSEWVAIGDMRAKEINSALAEAQGYANEIQARLSVDSSQYGWYEKQQAKLQSDYDTGMQKLIQGS